MKIRDGEGREGMITTGDDYEGKGKKREVGGNLEGERLSPGEGWRLEDGKGREGMIRTGRQVEDDNEGKGKKREVRGNLEGERLHEGREERGRGYI